MYCIIWYQEYLVDWYNDSADTGDSPHPHSRSPTPRCWHLHLRLDLDISDGAGPGVAGQAIKISKYNRNNITKIDAKYHRNELMLFRQAAWSFTVIFGWFAYIYILQMLHIRKNSNRNIKIHGMIIMPQSCNIYRTFKPNSKQFSSLNS